MTFPQIPPTIPTGGVVALAEDFVQRIVALREGISADLADTPFAVHIMGELTFSIALVELLQAKDVRCVATQLFAECDKSLRASVLCGARRCCQQPTTICR